jgi:uncharacterized protein (DUF362 family)
MITRRAFLKCAAAGSGVACVSPLVPWSAGRQTVRKARVAFVKTSDRATGVRRAIDLLDSNTVRGKDLFIKANFNSADPTPGSTHTDTLAALIRTLRAMGAGPLTLGERSGMGNTRQVLETMKVLDLAQELDVHPVVLDELPATEWELLHPQDTHWQRGFALPRPALHASGIVQTCCLKTHRFGGHFTLSLKNSVGLAAKRVPGDAYNFMSELHGSPHQRRMIAEINAAYHPDLVVLDGVDAFVNGGPDVGTMVHAQVVLAGIDRVAIDAVGVALLRHHGTTPEVSTGRIFDQEQLKRAVELNLGVASSDQIDLITGDAESAKYAAAIQAMLGS